MGAGILRLHELSFSGISCIASSLKIYEGKEMNAPSLNPHES